MASDELIILPALRAQRGANGGLILTSKYMDGVKEYAETWPGPVTSLVRVSDVPTTNLDPIEIVPGDGGPGVEVRPRDLGQLSQRVRDAALVVGFLAADELDATRRCHGMGVPFVHVSEYTLRTEMQIIDASGGNLLRRLRRKHWVFQADRRRRRIIPLSAGLQCSGTPTFDAYRELRPDSLLFFDNRVRAADCLPAPELEEKLDTLRRGEPLRLVFGGRFVPMKGVLHLPWVARALVDMRVPFHLLIVGGGPQEPELRAALTTAKVEEHVTLLGPLDFESEWIPLLKREADLFVCCHPQGDPSSIYPEVMSCGVPIAGYDNEAFAGIVRESGSGFLSPMGEARALAERIGALHRDRERLVDAARAGLAFAKAHCFERTFRRRVEHFLAVRRGAAPPRTAR